MKQRRPGLATAALLLATAVWGATFVTVKDALSAADTATFLALRFGVGALAALALAWPSTPRSAWRTVWRPGITLGALMLGGYWLQTLGLETTSPARSAFVTGLTVLFVPFVAWRLTGKRPERRAFIAPVIALVGLQQLTGVGWGDALPRGDVLTLGCAVLYGVHIAATSRVAGEVPTLALTTVQLAVVAVGAGVISFFGTRRFEPTPAFWSAVVFTGVVASALAIGLQIWGQAQVTAVRAAVIYALEPVFAVAWGALTGGDAPSRHELMGGGLLLLAVLVSEVRLSRATAESGDRA